MPRLLNKNNSMREEYELSLIEDTFISLNSHQGVVINGSPKQAIGVILHRYPKHFVLVAQHNVPIKVNGEKIVNHIRLLHDGDELSFNGKVFLFYR